MCKLFVTIRLVGYHRTEIDSFIHSRNVLEIAYPSFMHLANGFIGTVPTWYLFVFVCCCRCRCCCFFFPLQHCAKHIQMTDPLFCRRQRGGTIWALDLS